MTKSNQKLLTKNPKVDKKVISAIGMLQKKLPEEAMPKQGADYGISPPLGGQALSFHRQTKAV